MSRREVSFFVRCVALGLVVSYETCFATCPIPPVPADNTHIDIMGDCSSEIKYMRSDNICLQTCNNESSIIVANLLWNHESNLWINPEHSIASMNITAVTLSMLRRADVWYRYSAGLGLCHSLNGQYSHDGWLIASEGDGQFKVSEGPCSSSSVSIPSGYPSRRVANIGSFVVNIILVLVLIVVVVWFVCQKRAAAKGFDVPGQGSTKSDHQAQAVPLDDTCSPPTAEPAKSTAQLDPDNSTEAAATETEHANRSRPPSSHIQSVAAVDIEKQEDL